MPQCAGITAGHGATIAIELDPVGAQGVFTTVAQLNGDITVGLSRPEEDVTSHNDDIDTYTLGVLMRDVLTFGINFIFNDQTHDHLTGLIGKLRDNECFGVRYRGPAGAPASDEWIGSGQVSTFNVTNPVRVGARTAECGIRLSGPMFFDGDLQS
jgi:hypothetical protein